MRIIFWGTPQYSVNSLRGLINSKHEVLAVITQPDRKRSRGGKLTQSPVKEFAIKNNIPVLDPEKIKENKSFIEKLVSLNSDAFIVIAYGKILPKQILEIPKHGSWNAHASLLPKWRGAAPVQWALLSGDKFTGVGIMRMEEGLDTGDILIEEKVEIQASDNSELLHEKLSQISSKLIINSLDIISKNKSITTIRTIPQSVLNRPIKYARLLNKTDFKLDFNNSGIELERKVKGLYPNAYVTYLNKKLKILEIKILNDEYIDKYKLPIATKQEIKPNKIIKIVKDEGFIVSTKTNPILIKKVKLEGKGISTNNKIIQQLNPILGIEFQ